MTAAVLAAAKGMVVDYSIQEAYIAAIRRAERFLYIENQYFLGSSHAWANYIGAGACTHLVPIEIALKIAHQICAGKRFCVYVVLPMWPEGEPLISSKASHSMALEEENVNKNCISRHCKLMLPRWATLLTNSSHGMRMTV